MTHRTHNGVWCSRPRRSGSAAWRFATACSSTGRTHWAAAVRTRDGEIKVESGAQAALSAVAPPTLPGVRGVVHSRRRSRCSRSMKRRLPEARLPCEDVTTLGCDGRRGARRPGDPHGRLARAGQPHGRPRGAQWRCSSIAPALLALRGCDLAAYHGVEHKAIAGYEEGTDAADADKEHDRCGSHLVAPMLPRRPSGTSRCAAPGCAGRAAEAAVGLGSAARRRGGVRLGASAIPDARVRPADAGAPASRSSAPSARASRPRSSSRSAGPRSRRSCGSRVARSRLASSAPTPRAPRSRGLPAPRRADPRRVLHATPTSTSPPSCSTAPGGTRRRDLQVFQKQHSVLGGIDEAIAVLKLLRRTDWSPGLQVHALHEGDEIEP